MRKACIDGWQTVKPIEEIFEADCIV